MTPKDRRIEALKNQINNTNMDYNKLMKINEQLKAKIETMEIIIAGLKIRNDKYENK